MQSSLFEPEHIRPCPSYSRRRDRINLGLLCSYYKVGCFTNLNNDAKKPHALWPDFKVLSIRGMQSPLNGDAHLLRFKRPGQPKGLDMIRDVWNGIGNRMSSDQSTQIICAHLRFCAHKRVKSIQYRRDTKGEQYWRGRILLSDASSWTKCNFSHNSPSNTKVVSGCEGRQNKPNDRVREFKELEHCSNKFVCECRKGVGIIKTEHKWEHLMRCGYLATYPDQVTVLTTKGFSLHRGRFRRGQSLGRSGKKRHRSGVRRARGTDTLEARWAVVH